jgi:hypothetical protein
MRKDEGSTPVELKQEKMERDKRREFSSQTWRKNIFKRQKDAQTYRQDGR